MVRISNKPITSPDELPPLSPFATASDALKTSLPSLSPATRMAVVDAAEEFMQVNAGGRWVDFDRNVTPYMIEPANMLASRLYLEWIFTGPARTGKTVVLLTAVNHTIICDPGVTHITHMTEGTAEKWVDEELLPMIKNSPELASRQGTGRSDRNMLSKKFTGGTKLTIGPPTRANLSGRTIRLVLFTDLDRMPLTIGKEGSPFVMGAKRNETLGSRGMTAAEASPGHPIKDAAWRASTPNQLPPADGIVELYNGGTKGRWHWDCPECGHGFEPRFDLLKYDTDVSPADAGEMAYMVCPSGNGCVIEHSQKITLNRAGYWLHETAAGGVARIDSGDVLKTRRISYHLNGAAAAFSNWPALVEKYETAKRSFDNGGDEEVLKVIVNTDIGLPFLPRAMKEDNLLTLQFLQDKQREMPEGIAPSWTRFITVGVDVQAGRFAVQATAWGDGGERAVIDRFDLTKPPADAPRADKRALAPETFIEDWEVLRPLLEKAYPVQGSNYGLKPLAVGCDFHGAAGVSDRAEQFWHARCADGEQMRWFMIRGHGGFKQPDRVWYKSPERASNGKKARSIKLLNVATCRLKDSLHAALLRTEDGPGSLHLGKWLTDDHLTEFTAEKRGALKWEPRPNMRRNESIDISVYGHAVAIYKGMDRIDPTSPPAWAIAGSSNEFAVIINSDGVAQEKPRPAPKQPDRISYLE